MDRSDWRPAHAQGVARVPPPCQPDGCLHLIVDNYATHKHAKVKFLGDLVQPPPPQGARRRPDRSALHPTSSSWMNLVERFFHDLTVDIVRDGSFASVSELVDAEPLPGLKS